MDRDTRVRIRVLLALAATSALLFLLHAIGVYSGLYENLSWFDMVTHFLGGVCVGLGAVWLYLWSDSRVSFFVWMLVWLVVIGVAWEIGEYVVSAWREPHYALD